MGKFSKQFEIINKIKFIVKGKSIEKPSRVPDQETISEKIANRIQNTAYEHLKNKAKKDSFTKTYLIVAEQLGVENNQIYFAAVYTLAKIALNNAVSKKPILDILTKALDDNKDNKERIDYTSKKISEIKAGK